MPLPEWFLAMAVSGADGPTIKNVLQQYAIPLLVEVTVVIVIGGYVLAQRLDERVAGRAAIVDAQIAAEHQQMLGEIERLRSERALMIESLQRQLNEKTQVDADNVIERKQLDQKLNDLRLELRAHDKNMRVYRDGRSGP